MANKLTGQTKENLHSINLISSRSCSTTRGQPAAAEDEEEKEITEITAQIENSSVNYIISQKKKQNRKNHLK
ncbi:unnamed protein product [Rotaria magnacalcarata]